MERKTWGVVCLLIAVTVMPSHAWQVPDTGELKDLNKRAAALRRLMEDIKPRTEEYLDEAKIREGECEGYYKALPEDHYLMPWDTFHQFDEFLDEQEGISPYLGSLGDLDQELRDRRNLVESLEEQIRDRRQERNRIQEAVRNLEAERGAVQDALDSARNGERDAISAWLLREYGTRIEPPVRMELADRVIVISSVLFGTFVADHPRVLSPDAGRKQSQIIFKPAIFSGDLFGADIKLGPKSYSIPLPEGLTFKPASVKNGQDTREFELGQLDNVTFRNEIRWNWLTEAKDAFRGAEFDIDMSAVAPGTTSEGAAVATLPVKIERPPPPRGHRFWKNDG